MATHNAIFMIGGVSTKSIISQLLFSLDCYTWYQIKAYELAFQQMVRHANYLYLICIFMNINEMLKNMGKL